MTKKKKIYLYTQNLKILTRGQFITNLRLNKESLRKIA